MSQAKMDRTVAEQVVLNFWNGARDDGRLSEALLLLKISRVKFDGWMLAARRVTRRRNTLEVRTPTGGQRRRAA